MHYDSEKKPQKLLAIRLDADFIEKMDAVRLAMNWTWTELVERAVEPFIDAKLAELTKRQKP